ncbi:ADP-ribosylglycohydrolase family protein [Massilia genomosp. 1]|uniref:ADP-ribosylglycohydrolase family protein n=1 Tax=Massilia genomosp. 1 TaxID=2609280 RepID=A0ABX0MM38_9BURK|nr:ADP-ribosylglycohydrolase family protein [Massilia genomosp. 1]NHZ61690.1 ADP-ribosylglycohydrolase family protein [Massilia genomosp. 1]
MNRLSRALESLDGLSVGDAFGQCFFQLVDPDGDLAERRLPPSPWHYTDDTEMSLSILAGLARDGHIDQDLLAASLAARYDYERAYGPSMHRVLARIREGEDWRAVAGSTFEGQGSWGNGAAMRAAPLGAFFAGDLAQAAAQAALSAQVTHAHAEGVAGAVAVALAAAQASRLRGCAALPTSRDFLEGVLALLAPGEVRSRIVRAQSIGSVKSVQFAVSILGNGVGMSAQDTVPFALWCCSHHLDNYEEALWLAVSAGGDRDTICAIVGGIVACCAGAAAIPQEWKGRREPLPTWHLPSGSDGMTLMPPSSG